MISRRILTLFLILNLFVLAESLFEKTSAGDERKLEEQTTAESLVDVRAMLDQRDNDNPLSDLWDANHLKVTQQNVNLNMNMPLNRLKMKLDRTYQVKIVVENDQDFDRLYDYFYPKPAEEPKKKEETLGAPAARQLSKIKKVVKK